MKRLFIAVAAAVSMVLAAVVAAGQGEGAATRAVADPSKLTICHETGSASNPWRRISVSSRAMAKPSSRAGRLLRAHLRHRGDAIVVGTAPCPSVTDTPAPSSTPPARITICHNTGSESNPYRRITVSSSAVTKPSSAAGKVLRGHMRHTGDLVMPGLATCPSGTTLPGQGVKLSATLQPVQGAGGSGSAAVTIRLGLARLCATLTVSGLTNVTSAHIHRVSSGAVVVPLTAPTSGTASGCTTVERSVLQELARAPGAFYVNVHTTAYPDGQVQGRLSR